jgi:hypothetical protein
MQSLNIPSVEALAPEEFVRNSSQQFTTHNMDQSVAIPASLVEVLARTQKVLHQYESTCAKMQKHQR